MTRTLQQIEHLLSVHNPIIAEHLQRPLSSDRIRQKLSRIKLEGDIEPILDLYGWKNGTGVFLLPKDEPRPEPGFFPAFSFRQVFTFVELERALNDCDGFRQRSDKFSEGIGRYLPVLWGATSSWWFAIDVKPGNNNRVVFVDSRADRPFRPIYASFEALLRDIIGAYEESRPLTCFGLSRKQMEGLLGRLGQVLADKNPAALSALRPGLADDHIDAQINKSGIRGAQHRIYELYSWRNGGYARDCNLLPGVMGSNYQFLSLDAAISNYEGLNEGFQAAAEHLMTDPPFSIAQYLPIFWDGASGYIAIDIKSLDGGRVCLLDLESGEPTIAYEHFGEFIEDIIRAYVEEDELTCF